MNFDNEYDNIDNNDNIDKNLEKNKRTTFDCIGSQGWKEIESELDHRTMNVLQVLCDYVSDTKTDDNINILSCGDQYYELRKILVQHGILPNVEIKIEEKKNKKKNKKKQSKTKNEIIIANMTKKIMDLVGSTLKKKINDISDLNNIFNSPYVEVKLVGLMIMANMYIKKKMSEKFCYELIMGIKKALHSSNNIRNKNQQCITDLKNFITAGQKQVYKHRDKIIDADNLFDMVKFNYETLCYNYPKYLYCTKFDILFPWSSIKPYESQIDFLDKVKNFHSKNIPSLYFYPAAIGGGKTTSIVPLGRYIEQYNKRTNNDVKIIFACSVEPVLIEVAKMFYNVDIPFAIIKIQDEELKISPHFRYKVKYTVVKKKDGSKKKVDNKNKIRHPILHIGDLASSYRMLQKYPDSILFLDEPTVGADKVDHPVTKAFINIMDICPPMTILSSATLPEPEQIQCIVDMYKSRHPNGELIKTLATESLIGCEIICKSGESLLPHYGCKTKSELKNIIDRVENDPFIGRLYPAPVVCKILKRLENLNIIVPTLDDLFGNICNFNQTEIRKLAIKLLNILVDCDDDIIENVCRPIEVVITNINDVEKESDSDFDDSDNENEEYTSLSNSFSRMTYNFNEILTSQAHRYLGRCLVATSTPRLTAEKLFDELFKNKNISANNIIKQYNSELDQYDRTVEKRTKFIENSGRTINKSETARKEKYVDKDSKDVKSEKIQQLSEEKPKLKFSSQYRVNTINHIKKFCPSFIDSVEFDITNLQNINILENYNLNMDISDKLMLLLFAGIGVYDPDDRLLKQEYNKVILNMMKNGELAFIFSGEHIFYGAHFPLSHVYICDDIAENHSIKSIFQLMGRAGRAGQSYIAFAHIEDYCKDKFQEYILGDKNKCTIEAENIILQCDKFLQNNYVKGKEYENPNIVDDFEFELVVKGKDGLPVTFVPTTKIDIMNNEWTTVKNKSSKDNTKKQDKNIWGETSKKWNNKDFATSKQVSGKYVPPGMRK